MRQDGRNKFDIGSLRFEVLSGRRDSNPLPTAWEAVALPGELLPLVNMNLSNPFKISYCSLVEKKKEVNPNAKLYMIGRTVFL